MANIRTCNKHNMIACVEKTEHNADFHQIIDYLTGCSINYSLLVDPDLIGPWLQQFWATASLRSINEVPHIRAMVAGKRVLISEETIRADLLFDDTDGVDCFPKQVIWDSLRDIGYEGTPTQSAAQASILQGTADFQGTAEAQGAADIPQSPNDYTQQSKLGRNKDEGNLSEEHHDQDDHNHTAFVYEDFDATDAVVAVSHNEPDLEERVIKQNSPIRPTQEEEPEEQFKDDEFLADIPLNISRPRGLSIPGPMQSQPQQPTQTTDPKEKGKGILVEEPKKKKLTLQQIRALETAHDEEVARKVTSENGVQKKREKGWKI
ncbi:hypothetical protein Tco_0938415 [Tanacetum coccineum]|uniref:Uncharacterized protein n=1 Tax=Tanacetum coccineum TaxID=301880 RepID=A0ABQ5DH39_9ASTR